MEDHTRLSAHSLSACLLCVSKHNLKSDLQTEMAQRGRYNDVLVYICRKSTMGVKVSVVKIHTHIPNGTFL